jgi:hypothetical protein
LGIGCGENAPTLEKFTVWKSWRRPKPAKKGCGAPENKKKNKKGYIVK